MVCTFPVTKNRTGNVQIMGIDVQYCYICTAQKKESQKKVMSYMQFSFVDLNHMTAQI